MLNRLLSTGAAGQLGSMPREKLRGRAATLRLSDVADLGEAFGNGRIKRHGHGLGCSRLNTDMGNHLAYITDTTCMRDEPVKLSLVLRDADQVNRTGYRFD